VVDNSSVENFECLDKQSSTYQLKITVALSYLSLSFHTACTHFREISNIRNGFVTFAMVV